MKPLLGSLLFVTVTIFSLGQQPQKGEVVTSTWRNPDKPIEERVKALMDQLTLKEKISFLYWLTPAIDRLGIPAYDHGNEGLHGLVRPGNNTVFPQSIGLGATFDPDLIHMMTTAISDEARARWNEAHGHHLGLYSDVLVLWAPVINMARDPRWGRTQETYGEDPWLTSRMGVAFVEGLQGNDPHYLKVIACPKHMIANNEEEGRFGKNVTCDERYLYEYELVPYRYCVMEGKTQSVMSSYTSVNGVPSSANKWLLTDLLRGEWGFNGYVVSDCGAVSHVVDANHYAKSPQEAIADCLNAGLDMEGGYFARYPDVVNKFLPTALDQGLVKMEVVDNALKNVLTARFKLGMYDPPERVSYSTIPPSVIGSPEHIALARKIADESIVLLKNAQLDDTPLLPIDSSKVKKIVLVGPNATKVNLGDYSGVPTESITAEQGLEARAALGTCTVTTVPWQSGTSEVISSDTLTPRSAGTGTATGLTAEYFSSVDLTGAPAATRVDSQLNFNWAHIEPDPLASAQQFSVRWTGSIKSVTPGEYLFSLTADGGFRLYIDNKLVIDKWSVESMKRTTSFWHASSLTPGEHSVKLEYHHNGGETGLVLRWTTPVEQDLPTAVKEADLVIAIMGLSTQFETEGKDRKTLSLPSEQELFLKKIFAVNSHIVLVLESGSSLSIPWSIKNVPAIVQAWYPGQEGGNAIADILFGEANPSGRLPLTFYTDDSQLRPMQEYDLTKGRTYMYLKDKPAYAFGHGLSYTTFKYANLKLSKTTATMDDHFTTTVDVTNSGTRDGEEVVQGYIHAQSSTVPMPDRELWSFQKVSIPAGQTKTVTLSFFTKNFGHWDKNQHRYAVESGKFDIEVGAASDDIRETQVLEISK